LAAVFRKKTVKQPASERNSPTYYGKGTNAACTPLWFNPTVNSDHRIEPTASRRSHSVGFVSVLTLVLWSGCLSVGVLGFALPYSRPEPVPAPVEPMQAELLDVQLTTDPIEPDFQPPANMDRSMPAAPAIVARPQLPQAIPVAAVSAVAFALPVKGPTRLVEVDQAASSQQSAPTETNAGEGRPETLTFGHGDGHQPAPEYPARSRRERQEGSVSVQFTVGESGRVIAAEASAPCRWSLLNEAALRAVRERWRFPAGKPRVFEVTIRFELNR
jgi:periplasmic protein TonB